MEGRRSIVPQEMILVEALWDTTDYRTVEIYLAWARFLTYMGIILFFFRTTFRSNRYYSYVGWKSLPQARKIFY
jgi:hypothetical protein